LHARGCASKIKEILNKNFNVTGFVNPASNTVTLANSAKETIGNPTKKDVLVFWRDGVQMT